MKSILLIAVGLTAGFLAGDFIANYYAKVQHFDKQWGVFKNVIVE